MFVDDSGTVWGHGDRRIKGYDSEGSCSHTLYVGECPNGLLVVAGGRVLAGSRVKGCVQAWNVADLALMEEPTSLHILEEGGRREPEEFELEDGRAVLNLAESSWMDDTENVEITKGESRHEVLRLQGVPGHVTGE